MTKRSRHSRPRALVMSGAGSNIGKTTLTLGVIRALRDRGVRVAAAKSGPDYIDPGFLAAASGGAALTLDAFAMDGASLRARAQEHMAREHAELLIVEGAMGLFDGANGAVDTPAIGLGATARVAAALGAPIVMVVNAKGRGQSAVVELLGAATLLAAWRRDAPIVSGALLNDCASPRHHDMARGAIKATGFRSYGAVPHRPTLALPSRHLGLEQAQERSDLERFISDAASLIEEHVDLDELKIAAAPIPREPGDPFRFAPLGQRIAIARDSAFAFAYAHMLEDWRAQGAEILPFSPLADEGPADDADAVFLPGGYPELHGAALSKAAHFQKSMRYCAERGVAIYGECGGYMVLGDAITDVEGRRWPMLGLLPLESRMQRRFAALGYRRLTPIKNALFKEPLNAHEFHYAQPLETRPNAQHARLFRATDAAGTDLGDMGHQIGSVFGSFAHIIAPEPAAEGADDL